MTATILYCLATLLIGLLITIATYEAYIYARPRVIGKRRLGVE